MSWVTLAAVVLVGAVLLAILLRRQARQPSDAYPYRKLEALFSPAERSFLGVLEEACGQDIKVFGKVRVADVVAPLAGLDGSKRQSAFNKISSKHFDFLLCSGSDLSAACAIELHDRSHQRSDRQSRDEFLQGVCKAVSLPLLEFKAKRGYSVEEVRASIQEALSSKTVSSGAPASELPPEAQQPAESPSEPLCPECAIPMVHRTGRRGTLAGKEFWGCTNYPKCHATRPINA